MCPTHRKRTRKSSNQFPQARREIFVPIGYVKVVAASSPHLTLLPPKCHTIVRRWLFQHSTCKFAAKMQTDTHPPLSFTGPHQRQHIAFVLALLSPYSTTDRPRPCLVGSSLMSQPPEKVAAMAFAVVVTGGDQYHHKSRLHFDRW